MRSLVALTGKNVEEEREKEVYGVARLNIREDIGAWKLELVKTNVCACFVVVLLCVKQDRKWQLELVS